MEIRAEHARACLLVGWHGHGWRPGQQFMHQSMLVLPNDDSYLADKHLKHGCSAYSSISLVLSECQVPWSWAQLSFFLHFKPGFPDVVETLLLKAFTAVPCSSMSLGCCAPVITPSSMDVESALAKGCCDTQ